MKGDYLPLDVWLHILSYCDQRTCVSSTQVCSQLNAAALGLWRCKTSLNVFKEFFKDHCRKPSLHRSFSDAYVHACILKNGLDFDFSRLVNFIAQFMPKLVSLSFSGCNLMITSSDLRELANRLPNLEALDLSQHLEQPKLASDCLSAIAYFNKLKKLNLDGLAVNPIFIKPLTHELLPNLESLSFICSSGMLFRTISLLRQLNLRFSKLKDVRLGNRSWVTVNESDLKLLHWFMVQHGETLTHVHLQDFVFDTPQHMKLIFQSLHNMSQLVSVTLDNCTCRHPIIPHPLPRRNDRPRLNFNGWIQESQRNAINALFNA